MPLLINFSANQQSAKNLKYSMGEFPINEASNYLYSSFFTSLVFRGGLSKFFNSY